MKVVIVALVLAATSVLTQAKPVYAYNFEDGNTVLHDTKCEKLGYKFTAKAEGKEFDGCYFVTTNEIVVLKRNDDGTVWAYPLAIFGKVEQTI